ncbi:TPA: SH3 domain-containing protein [Escherichia coli]|uniref:SH3 domain-containing protein n=1 Tax=Escherichia TaxID=561 RepID=UPI0019956581|nr:MULTISPECIES: SH3 domain-containing protein [Escherichia]MDY9122261.1 SH3 domain-containing protein [Escherichia coli]MDY9188912.1 SH3 domain-containing protein [Escherichia coli]MDY9257130.1 SH3 domain-containing protein [Escherichia coli]WDB54768.1 SH3 domain-containing protein [Escherichia albertii]HAL7767910.1 SH3 domain-containing protein [Escherichia coli]
MKNLVFLAAIMAVSLVGCKAPVKLQVTDDTIETTQVNGVNLTHRHLVVPPTEFTPINAEYRALYSASVLNQAGYGGKVIAQLVPGASYIALGQAQDGWIALANEGQGNLIGYAPANAVVKSELYYKTVLEQSKRPKLRKKATCVSVDGNTKACKNDNNGTWILD